LGYQKPLVDEVVASYVASGPDIRPVRKILTIFINSDL
jgi:hypothetical protein